ncbi:MAG TPA: serine/threonine-protein kinase [Gemmatimonadales bacterium]|nr:serine/threonine-protein kinase [Gemmatimonadales bacterium]
MPQTQDLLAAISPLLDEVLDLPPDARALWLAELRANRPELAAELEILLAAEAGLDARGFLTVAAAPEPGTLPSLAGHRIGAYSLVRPIGHGGMGTVWLAQRSDGRYEAQVAIKLLNLALIDPVGSERFRREGTALARLTHPNIARLIDAGVTEEGQPYLVLEYVEGRRIDVYCDAERLVPERRLGLFLQVLGAVAHAHANLVVHRDLKPSNILVTADETVKLLDFGIAKLLAEDSGAAERTGLTDRGGAPLTPEYAAPEQAQGRPVTTGTDIYSLGVLLYVLLAGRHPTGAGCHTVAEHLRALGESEPPRLSAVVAGGAERGSTVERLRRLYRGDLDNIVAKALKKRPEERYATVQEFTDDLHRYLRDEPVRARPDSLGYRLGKFVRRNRAALAAVLAVMALLAGAALRERQLRGRAEREARKAGAVEQYLVSVFGAADPFALTETDRSKTTARDLLDRGAQRIDTALALQPDVRAELRGALGRVYASLSLYDAAATQLRRSLQERRSLYGPRNPAVAEAMDQLGQVLFRQGHLAEADSLLRGALAQRREHFGSLHDATAESLDHLAALLVDRDDFAHAEPLLREALAIRRTLHGDDDLSVAASRTSLAGLLHSRGANTEALPLLRDALAIRERRLGRDHPLTAETLTSLASTEEFLGHYAPAESLFRRAIAAQRKSLGSVHRSVAVSLGNLGEMLFKVGRNDEAAALLREALAINRQVLGERTDEVSSNLGNLALIVRDQGDFDEAERLLRQALQIDKALYGPEHFNVGYDLNELAVVLRMKYQSDSAIAMLREALRLSRKVMGENDRGTLAITVHLGRALREVGKLEEAEGLLRNALAKFDPNNADTRLLSIPGQIGLGRTLTGLGRPAEAMPLLEAALTASRDQLGPDNPRTAEATLGLGECLVAVGQLARAEPLLRQADSLLSSRRKAQPRLAAEADLALSRLARNRQRQAAIRR